MAITFTCPGCKKQHTVSDDVAGRTARCKFCGQELRIPGGEGASLEIGDASPPPASPAMAVAAAPTPSQAASGMMGQPNETGNRRFYLIALGVILLIGGFIPTPIIDSQGNLSVQFQNFMALNDPNVLVPDKILGMFPLGAGLLLIIFGAALEFRIRGLFLLALFATPIVLTGIQQPNIFTVQGLIAITTPSVGAAGQLTMTGDVMGLVLFGCFAGGATLILVSARSRVYRPHYGHVYWIGLVGAAAFILSLVLPIETDPAVGPRMVIMHYVDALANAGSMPGAALAFLIVWLCVNLFFAIAALLSLFNLPIQGPRGARGLAGGIFVLCVLGIIQFIAMTIIMPYVGIAQMASQGVQINASLITVMILIQVKELFWIGGWLLLLPTGLIDLIVGRRKRVAA